MSNGPGAAADNGTVLNNGAPPAGGSDNPANNGANAGANNGSNGAGASFLDGLNEDNRRVVQQKGWKGLDDVVSSYREAESRLSKTVQPPKEGATEEELSEFFRKSGRPAEPDGYKISMPENLPEGFIYSTELADQFRNWAHKSGLHPLQAQRLHDMYVAEQASVYTSTLSETKQTIEKAHADLTKEWGDPKSALYKRNVELANRAIKNLGGDDLERDLIEGGLVLKTENGLVVQSSAFAKAFAKIGSQLFAEDTIHGGGTGEEANPFDEKTLNLKRQGEILKRDPAQARALITAAGKDPSLYML